MFRGFLPPQAVRSPSGMECALLAAKPDMVEIIRGLAAKVSGVEPQIRGARSTCTLGWFAQQRFSDA